MKEFLKKFTFLTKLYEKIFYDIHENRNAKNYRKEHCEASYGELNKDKTFLVIHNDIADIGVFSYILFKLGIFKMCEEKNYIPIIDLKDSYVITMQDREFEGKENAWEYYFEQPGGDYSLDEVYSSKKVLHFAHEGFRVPTYDTKRVLVNSPEMLKAWKHYLDKYIRLAPKLRERVDAELAKFPKDAGVMAVGVRSELRWGAMLEKPLYKKHSVVPSCEEFIECVEKKMAEWGYEYLYISCEDREYKDQIAKHFGDKCLYIERPLFHFFTNGQPTATDYYDPAIIGEFKDSSIRQKTEDYITEIYIMAACDALYATLEGGTVYASVLNGATYKHRDFYDGGDYQY